jgi:hypothetical protein
MTGMGPRGSFVISVRHCFKAPGREYQEASDALLEIAALCSIAGDYGSKWIGNSRPIGTINAIKR